MPEPNLSHDDYCRIFGRIIFDAFYRIDSLEKQIGPLHESFQAQVEGLRSQLVNVIKKNEDLERKLVCSNGKENAISQE